MPPDRVLILGGTGEARMLAETLTEAGFATITSMAGVTREPRLPVGEIHMGGFGGQSGLTEYVRRERIAAIVDATHPFATQISRHGHGAALQAGIPYLRFEREAWQPEPADDWIMAPSIAAAVSALPLGARVMVTVGRKEIGVFFARRDLRGIARMIEAPQVDVPEGWTLILERPPFDVADECALMTAHRIEYLVAKNSGGSDTRAKLVAAREIKIPVMMVARPGKPDAPSFSSASELIPALRRLLSA